jgi:SAM-dependent methyltransferase
LKLVSEIKRVLRPGGLVFITVCGRYSKGKVRHCLVETAKQISPNTYVPTQGNERGLVHYIYSKKRILLHFRDFSIESWFTDSKGYYCFFATLTKCRSN